MATKVNLFPDQGAKYQHIYVYKDKATGAVIPITGWLIEMQARAYPTDETALLDIDTDLKGGIEITDGANGEFTITIAAATSAAWRHSELSYDIVGTPPAEDPERIAQGTIFVSKSTTR